MTSFLNFSSENNLRELSASSTAIKIFQYIGNFFALIFFASPLFQIIKLKLYKEHQDISNVPLFLILTIIFNCLFWLLNAFSSEDFCTSFCFSSYSIFFTNSCFSSYSIFFTRSCSILCTSSCSLFFIIIIKYLII